MWSTTTRTRINDATAVIFSVKCLSPLKLYPLSRNIFRKRFATYFLFIHEHFIIVLSPTINLIAVTTLLLTSGLHRCQQRIFKKNTNYFYAIRISISLAICLKFSVKLVTFSESYARKYKWVFFLEHSVQAYRIPKPSTFIPNFSRSYLSKVAIYL